MSNSTDTFRRYEKKYMMDKNTFERFIHDVSSHIKKDEYYKYTIRNIYYDTDNYEIIRKSIEKPVYKEKLRVRSYDSSNSNDEVFIELKKKYKKQVYKRRISVNTSAFNQYLLEKPMSNVSGQVLDEIEFFRNMYHAKPKVFIAYDRLAFKGIEDEGIRITCDENIRYRTDNLSIFESNNDSKILTDNQRIVEIKVLGAMPLWLSSSLNKYKIYPTSFSKVGYCYTNCILNESA